MRLRGLPGLVVLGILLLFIVPSGVAYYTDWLWFQELGYQRVFLRQLNAQTMVFAVTFGIAYLFLFLNLRLARGRTVDRPRVVIGRGADGRPVSLEGRQVAGLAVPVSAVAALLMAVTSASNWLAWLNFLHAKSFGMADPIYGHDVAFYVFRLPVYQLVRQQALVMSLIALVGCGVYYVFSGSFVIEAQPKVSAWPRIRLVPIARRHLSVLTAFVLGLMAWGAWLEVPTTLITPTAASVAFGASYSDIYARIPFIWMTFAVLILGVGLALSHGFSRRSWLLPAAIVLYLAVASTGGIYASFVQRLVVTPDEQNKELPYITHNIEATRRAYSLDRVEEKDLSGDGELDPDDVIANAATIENVRLWDHEPLKQTFAQIQEIRPYYDFIEIDNDRYTIDGRYRQVMLSARELNTENLPTRTWVSERLSYTHGYGVTLGPVNQVTTEGLPVLFIQNLPPVSSVNIKLDQPSIYYGELSKGYALVKTKQEEFDYPKGDDNVYAVYGGTGGVPVASLLRRLAFAIRFGSTDILFTTQFTPDSRIIFYRQIAERVRLLAPFLAFDADPYPVISSGKLFWMQDAYTTTANYPYSTRTTSRFGEINYIRNSVKIVTDAYNGSVQFYVSEPDDPLIRTVQNVFPGMLHPLSEMPEDLRRHVRYPEDIFRVQAQVYAVYHMTNPTVFYNKEDQWQIPLRTDGQNASPMQPYYTIMKLPGEKQTEFIQMLPFTPGAKDNLSAWMVARSDAEHYGRLLVYQFPKQKIVYGPRQIEGRINQDQEISPQITLWNQQGSEVRWGDLLVIPINESLIYVRPLYLRSSERGIPELKRVVVAYQSKIVMAETLTLGLAKIFGNSIVAALAPDRLASNATSVVETSTGAEAPPAVPPTSTDTVKAETLKSVGAEIQAHLDAAEKAQRAGDWTTYGEEQRKLKDAVQKLNDAIGRADAK